MKYWLVLCGESMRYAKQKTPQQAAIAAFGLHTPNMIVVQFPSNPKYLSQKKRQEIHDQATKEYEKQTGKKIVL